MLRITVNQSPIFSLAFSLTQNFTKLDKGFSSREHYMTNHQVG